MRQEQLKAAQAAMIEWLAHPQELGKAPARIECAGTFDLHELRYYIFKYKESLSSQWMLGVCGGYEEDELEHCGHVYSEMEVYDEADAKERAVAMVEMIRAYWMEQARQAEEAEADGERAGSFAGFVLLADNSWDKEQLVRDLREEWNIDAEEDGDSSEDALVFSVGDKMAAVSLMPAPIPGGEAEACAENNYMWPQAVETARAHQAHIMVAVLGGDDSIIERGKLYTKLLACCCKQKNATGVYTSGVVFEPRFYEGFADMMKEDELPIFNWIWFGLYRGKDGVCGYTYGMDVFGKDEMEVLDADAEPAEVRDFLASLVSYVLACDVTLLDGETIGFSEEDKHAITRSEGAALPEQTTLKITY
ncbi:MAG: DUF4261 domain-containing protein [Clostridiales bacterium]|nr:DUF4261 domain-containing protein [Clostridiales bacterium]